MKTTNSVVKKTCSCCGNEKKLGDYYYSSTYLNKATKTLPICKQCILDYVQPEYKNIYDMKKVKSILRQIDRPYIQSLWDASIDESDKRGKDSDYFRIYMKNIAMNQNKDLTWQDSEFTLKAEIDNKTVEANDEDLLSNITNEDMKRFRKMWGEFPLEDYMFLEDFYGEYVNNFPTDTPAQINIYKGLAKIHLQAEKELSQVNIKGYKDLMELSSKMHNDGNIKPIQSSGANDDKGLSTYGLWIKTIENDEPCEYFEDKPTYEDYDGFKKYIEKWLLRPMKNIFGVSKDFDVGDGK